MADLTPERLAEIRQRAHDFRFLAPSSGFRVNRIELDGREDLDALGALVGTDVPALLAEVARLSQALEVAESAARHAKELMRRRTETLRRRAERAEEALPVAGETVAGLAGDESIPQGLDNSAAELPEMPEPLARWLAAVMCATNGETGESRG